MKTALDRVTVEYAYPTSRNASKFGFGRIGCWCVELTDSTRERPPLAIAAFQTKERAIAHAEKMGRPWDSLFIAHNPQFAA